MIFEEVELEKKKQLYDKEDLKKLALHKISSIEANIHIYTDGSTSGNQINGGAGVHIEYVDGVSEPVSLHQASYAAGALCSSYTGEWVALLEARKWIENNQEHYRFLICTDSKSLHESLQSNDWKDQDPGLKEIETILKRLRVTIKILCWHATGRSLEMIRQTI